MSSYSSIARALVLTLTVGAAFSAHAGGERECDVCPAFEVSRAPKEPVVAKADSYRECDVCPSVGESKQEKVLLTQASTDQTK